VTMHSTSDGCPRFASAYLGRICSLRTLLAGSSVALARKIVKRLKGFPVFAVDFGDVGELHAAFLNESRTREHGWDRVQEIRDASSFSAHIRSGEPGAPVHLFQTWGDWKIPQWRER
jgi:hypothetical protein